MILKITEDSLRAWIGERLTRAGIRIEDEQITFRLVMTARRGEIRACVDLPDVRLDLAGWTMLEGDWVATAPVEAPSRKETDDRPESS